MGLRESEVYHSSMRRRTSLNGDQGAPGFYASNVPLIKIKGPDHTSDIIPECDLKSTGEKEQKFILQTSPLSRTGRRPSAYILLCSATLQRSLCTICTFLYTVLHFRHGQPVEQRLTLAREPREQSSPLENRGKPSLTPYKVASVASYTACKLHLCP